MTRLFLMEMYSRDENRETGSQLTTVLNISSNITIQVNTQLLNADNIAQYTYTQCLLGQKTSSFAMLFRVCLTQKLGQLSKHVSRGQQWHPQFTQPKGHSPHAAESRLFSPKIRLKLQAIESSVGPSARVPSRCNLSSLSLSSTVAFRSFVSSFHQASTRQRCYATRLRFRKGERSVCCSVAAAALEMREYNDRGREGGRARLEPRTDGVARGWRGGRTRVENTHGRRGGKESERQAERRTRARVMYCSHLRQALRASSAILRWRVHARVLHATTPPPPACVRARVHGRTQRVESRYARG